MKIDWFKCPICGHKLLKIDKETKIHGVFIKCKRCTREIEIINFPEPKPEPEPATKVV